MCQPSRAARALLALLASIPSACHLGDPAARASDAPDPALGAVALGSRAGWDASLVMDAGGVGVWSVDACQVFESSGAPEILGLDDLGRCNVLSAKGDSWTPLRGVYDGEWLAAHAVGEVDPRVPGEELYVAGRRGNVYQVVGHRSGVLDSRLIAELAGYEVHALVAGDLEPEREGDELLAFTDPGGLAFLRPAPDRAGFVVDWVQDLPGRVRDALVLPPLGGGTPWIATASRAGRIELLRFTSAGPEWRVVHEEPAGFDSLALRPLALGPEPVLYSTCDDGRVLRHAKDAEGRWQTELVFAGPRAPRGLVAGRFTSDPKAECLAVFGYGREVVLLVRGESGWSAETIFEDTAAGFDLAAAELDGRNATDELVACGYSGRVVLLARPPGYGLPGVAVEAAH